MAISVKNSVSGEIVRISDVGVDATGRVFNYKGEKTSRFISKYAGILTETRDVDGVQFFEFVTPWEVTRRAKVTKKQTPAADVDGDSAPVERPETPVMPSEREVVDAFAALTPLFAGVQKNVENNIMAKLQPILDRVPTQIQHVIVTATGEKRDAGAGRVFHENFDFVLNAINNGISVYLYGPTGSGKNVMAEQIADALNLAFHYQAHVTDRFELTGFIDAAGNYQETEFYRAFTRGGLFMLDELDASDENALITLNSACNGYFAFPNGTKKMHENFRMIAAGNTCGRGASEEYTGRCVIDASSLGRFLPVPHNYTRAVDMAAANDDEELVAFGDVLRRIKNEMRVDVIVSPRQYVHIKKVQQLGADDVTALREFSAFITEDDTRIIAKKLRDELPENQYVRAFSKLYK